MLGSCAVVPPEDLEDRGGVGLAPQPERAQRSKQQPVCVLHHGFGRKHMRAEMLVQALQPRGGVRRVADDAVQKAASAAGVPDIDVAVLESDPRLEVTRTMLLAQSA